MMKCKLSICILAALVVLMTACNNKGVTLPEEASVSECEVSVSEENNPEMEEIPISFEPENVMMLPANLKVTHAGKEITARVNAINWAYAVNDLEWSSVNEKYSESIDGEYEECFVQETDTTDFLLTFDGKTLPEAIVHVYRYPAENWVQDPHAEGEDGLKFRDAIEHWDDYDEYEEMEIQVLNDTEYIIVTIPGDTAGYIYEIKAAWDTELYRGSCIYSFKADKAFEDNNSEE